MGSTALFRCAACEPSLRPTQVRSRHASPLVRTRAGARAEERVGKQARTRGSKHDHMPINRLVVLSRCFYSAAWAYEVRGALQGFMRSTDWMPPQRLRDRENAAWGWHELRANPHSCASGPGLFVQHLGASLEAYYRHPGGFNTIPALPAVDSVVLCKGDSATCRAQRKPSTCWNNCRRWTHFMRCKHAC